MYARLDINFRLTVKVGLSRLQFSASNLLLGEIVIKTLITVAPVCSVLCESVGVKAPHAPQIVDRSHKTVAGLAY